jgi:hypothetical protein
VHDPESVSIPQGICDFFRNPKRIGERELRLPPESVAERLTFHEGHAVPELPLRGSGIVNGKDMGMLEASREPNLPFKALGPKTCCQVRAEHFQSNMSIVAEIMGKVDGSHSPAPKLTLEDIAVCQASGETLWEI